jgi:hypothetical protein
MRRRKRGGCLNMHMYILLVEIFLRSQNSRTLSLETCGFRRRCLGLPFRMDRKLQQPEQSQHCALCPRVSLKSLDSGVEHVFCLSQPLPRYETATMVYFMSRCYRRSRKRDMHIKPHIHARCSHRVLWGVTTSDQRLRLEMGRVVILSNRKILA